MGLTKWVFLAGTLTLTLAADYDGKIRDAGDGRFEAYMIPPSRSNHASFLELIPQNGILVMGWFSGTGEGEDKCSIVVAHLLANATQWSNATLVSRRDGYSNQNPVLYYDSEKGVLNLFHTQQKAKSMRLIGGRRRRGANHSSAVGSEEGTSHIWQCVSTDQIGIKWSQPKEIFAKDGSFDRNRIVKSTVDGSLIYPIYYAVDGSENQYSAMKISQDHVNWKGYPVAHSNYLVQPTVIRPVPDRHYLRAFFRDRKAEHVYSASSTNEGFSWTEPKKTVLPNNNAAIQATVLSSGNVAIVFNPTNKARNVLRVAISTDGGDTWPHYRDLEHTTTTTTTTTTNAAPITTTSATRMRMKEAEYSYPSIMQTTDGYIHISYTYNRETIKYVRLKESWVTSKRT